MSTTEKGTPRHGRRRSAQMAAATASGPAPATSAPAPAAPAAMTAKISTAPVGGAQGDKVIVELGLGGDPVFRAPAPRAAAPTPAPAPAVVDEELDLDAEHLEFDDDERSQRLPTRPDASGKDALIGMLVHDAPQPDDPLDRVRAAPGEVPALHSDAGLYTMWIVIIGLLVAGGIFGVWAVFFYRPL